MSDLREPSVYRACTLLAYGATVLGGTPLGIWLMAGLYLGAAPVPLAWMFLHASLQIFGFFATLIVGVAPHLLARFTGRAVTDRPLMRWLAIALAIALVGRVSGTWAGAGDVVGLAALLQAASFFVFAGWVWRSLDPPPLGLLRRQLTLGSLWLGAACVLEVIARARAARQGVLLPELGAMRAVHSLALLGGVLGWVLGVLLRAGPMFVAHWRIPTAVANGIPWMLALGACVVAAGEMGVGGAQASLLARLGELIALATPVVVAASAGAFRRAGPSLPMLSRGGEEARIFRLAAVSGVAAGVGATIGMVTVMVGHPIPLLGDAVRHLFTVGFLTAVVIAMTLRLVPVLERVALPWPAARRLAFWALAAAVVLRGSQVVVGLGWPAIGLVLPLSGALVWIGQVSAAANLVGAVIVGRRLLR